MVRIVFPVYYRLFDFLTISFLLKNLFTQMSTYVTAHYAPGNLPLFNTSLNWYPTLNFPAGY